MSDRNSPKLWIACCVGSVLFFASLAQATVYGWKSADGALNLSNDLEAVPELHRETAQRFTSKLAGKITTKKLPPAAGPEAVQLNAYERGLERGLQTAAQQVELAGKLARTVLTAAPVAPPIRIVIQQPPQHIIRHIAPSYLPPFYGFVGPYAPYSRYGSGYTYGFGHSRLVPHSHFFPGTRGRRRGLFFPRGHFSQDGFLFGHGVVVR